MLRQLADDERSYELGYIDGMTDLVARFEFRWGNWTVAAGMMAAIFGTFVSVEWVALAGLTAALTVVVIDFGLMAQLRREIERRLHE